MSERNIACSMVAIMLIGGLMTSQVEAAEKPSIVPTNYDNVTFNELVSVYKQAYAEAGFAFKSQTTQNAKLPGRSNFTELVFEFANPDYPHRNKAVPIFKIMSTASGDQVCAPCSMYTVTLAGYLSGYDEQDYAAFGEKIIAAHRKALEQVRVKLGRSVQSP